MPDQCVPIHAEFRADATTARSAALALLRARFLTWGVLLPLVIVECLGVVVLVAHVMTHPRSVPWIALFLIVLPIHLVWSSATSFYRAAMRVFPDGGGVGVGFAPSAIRLRTSVADSTIGLAAFRRVRKAGGFVILQETSGGMLAVPGSIVPEPWFDYLARSVAAPPRPHRPGAPNR